MPSVCPKILLSMYKSILLHLLLLFPLTPMWAQRQDSVPRRWIIAAEGSLGYYPFAHYTYNFRPKESNLVLFGGLRVEYRLSRESTISVDLVPSRLAYMDFYYEGYEYRENALRMGTHFKYYGYKPSGRIAPRGPFILLGFNHYLIERQTILYSRIDPDKHYDLASRWMMGGGFSWVWGRVYTSTSLQLQNFFEFVGGAAASTTVRNILSIRLGVGFH